MALRALAPIHERPVMDQEVRKQRGRSSEHHADVRAGGIGGDLVEREGTKKGRVKCA